MALTENKVLKSIEVIPEAQSVNVLWENQVLRDGVVISQTLERSAYNELDKIRFMSDVSSANEYITILGWK